MSEIENIANKILTSGKGILAADESTGTMTKRLSDVNVDSTATNRLKFRETLFSAESMKNNISGVILYDETIKQKTTSGKSVPELIKSFGSLAGIKVDTGAKKLAGSPEEKITEGLDGLRQRLEEYYNLGARFAKWRAVITIDDNIPSDACIYSNAHSLARYASLCQEVGLVPIVEPEVLMNGNHTIETCFEVTQRTQNIVFEQLLMHHVLMEGMILKPNMVISALHCSNQADIDAVADMTFKCLIENVPSDVAGIAFLSGGQSSDLACMHLNRMNVKYKNDMPWNLSFSYGRALQHDSLIAWNGNDRTKGQEALYYRAKCNSYATNGRALNIMNTAM